jgi:tetratricopeptide (TPR) repeat protein
MFENDEPNLDSLIERFEEMLSKGEENFFDADEFELISDFYFETGKIQKALYVTQLAERQHPYTSTFPLKRAQFLTASDNIEEALAALSKVEEMDPDNVELLIARGTIFSKKGLHQKAINLFKKAYSRHEFPEEVLSLVANEYQFMGNFEMALKHHKEVLKFDPEDDIALYSVSLCYEMLNQNNKAIEFFQQHIESEPFSEQAWYHLANLFSKAENFEKAFWAIDYALLIDEEFTAAYYEKARVLERMDRFEEAAQTYKDSFLFDAPSAYGYYKIGCCYSELEDLRKAKIFLTKAVKEDPSLDEAHLELSLILDELNEMQEAFYHINKACDLDSENPEYLLTKAEICKRMGLLYESSEAYTELLELGHTDTDIYMEYSELLISMDEVDQGMELLYKGVLLNPLSAEIRLYLAGFLYLMQEEDEASIYFKQGLKIDFNKLEYFEDLFPSLLENEKVQLIIQSLRQN